MYPPEYKEATLDHGNKISTRGVLLEMILPHYSGIIIPSNGALVSRLIDFACHILDVIMNHHAAIDIYHTVTDLRARAC
jgi:hypothetical protein